MKKIIIMLLISVIAFILALISIKENFILGFVVMTLTMTLLFIRIENLQNKS